MANKSECKVGQKAPDFSLPNHEGETFSLKGFKGKWLVLYFYPKDNTSGCALEAVDFTERLNEFEDLNATVVGVSPDPPERHTKFIAKHNLKVILLSDPDHSALQAYGVWQKKKLYGREFMGVVRTTVLIDPKGVLAHTWHKVKVKGHAEEVKLELEKLQGAGGGR